MKIVILAGGRGTRLAPVTDEVPKPMVPLAGKPMVTYQIELARRYGLTDILFLVGYKGKAIQSYFGDGTEWGLAIEYIQEDEPLGTAGAVRQAYDAGLLDSSCLVFYGDVLMDVSLPSLIRFHQERNGAATLVVHPNDHPADSDLVGVTLENRIKGFYSKPHLKGTIHRNLANAALYIVEPKIIELIQPGVPSDFGRDIFPRAVAESYPLYAYNTAEYIKDVGTWDRLNQVEIDINQGVPSSRNRDNPRPAVFLDRDGVINSDHPEHIRTPEQLKLLPGSANAIKKLNKAGIVTLIVTNQPAIAKGFIDFEDLDKIHAEMEMSLGAEGAFVDRIYFCPHHPKKGFDGERAEYKIKCECRKPAPGMIETGIRDYNIDRKRSVMIGDRLSDIEAGRRAGLTTILISPPSEEAPNADFQFASLDDATEFLTKLWFLSRICG